MNSPFQFAAFIALGLTLSGLGATAQETIAPGEHEIMQPMLADPDAPQIGSYAYGPTAAPAEGCWTGQSAACNTFPYGAPLVGYEGQSVCYPHGHCKRYCTHKERAQCSHWGYPEYFCEPPYGVKTRAFLHTQVHNGLVRQLALYNYDFLPLDTGDGAELKPRGLHEIARIAQQAQMLQDPYAVVTIEPTGDLDLDAARRTVVFDELARFGAPVGADQVVTANAAAIGRDGIEARHADEYQLEQVKAGGANLSTELGGSDGGSSGGGGGNLLLLLPVAGAGGGN